MPDGAEVVTIVTGGFLGHARSVLVLPGLVFRGNMPCFCSQYLEALARGMIVAYWAGRSTRFYRELLKAKSNPLFYGTSFCKLGRQMAPHYWSNAVSAHVALHCFWTLGRDI